MVFPAGGELALEIKLQPGDTRLGFAISRTEEVIHTDESTPRVASTCSGPLELYHSAHRAKKLPAGEMMPTDLACAAETAALFRSPRPRSRR
jgi:hypothetical protein